MRRDTKQLVIAAMLSALSAVIAYIGIKLPLPQPFSVTIGSHAPTIVAMFISPLVALGTVIGSVIGFIPLGPVVMIRAASHIIFALVGAYMLKHRTNPYVMLFITGIVHGVFEGIIVLAFGKDFSFAVNTVAFITLLHHIADSVIAAIVLIGLESARFINPTGLLRKRL